MEADPIKRRLNEIEDELEAALSNLNSTNQRVDDLLTEYAEGELSAPRETAREAAEVPVEGAEESEDPSLGN